MSDAQASAAGRSLANLRWRGRVAIRSAQVAAERIAELPDDEVVRLEHQAAEERIRREAVARAEGRSA